MSPDKLRIGTRSSPLALWQAHRVGGLLEQTHAGLSVEYIEIATQGDIDLESPLAKIGGKGLFTGALEQALAEGRVDLAVHSLKDLPTALPEGMALGAACLREEPWDALLTREAPELDALPEGARVAAGSLRRRAQLLHRRPDLELVDLRGNIGTRLDKFERAGWDAMVLATAGLERLGLGGRIRCRISPDVMLPAVGQGALGIEIRAGDLRVGKLLVAIEDPATRAAVDAERALLARLGGGCHTPIGAHGRVENGQLRLDGMVARPDGSLLLRERAEGALGEPEALGTALAERLIAAGADRILESLDHDG